MVDLSKFYSPHDGQKGVHSSKAKEKWVEAARRWGKGRTAFGELLEAYIETTKRPRSVIEQYQLVPPGLHAWIVVPSYPQGRQVWNELLQLLPPAFKGQVDRDGWIVYLRYATPDLWGMIEVKSSFDSTSLQTVGLDFLHISESQDVDDEAFRRLRPVLRSPGRLGRGFYEGIPALWRDHWFWRGCESAKENGHQGRHQYWRFTVYDNPLLPKEMLSDVENDRELLTESTWRRMYLAERSESAGFFKNIDSCIVGDLLTEPLPGKNYVGGMDLAGGGDDLTVLHIFDADERKLVYHQTWDATPWPDVRQHVAAIHAEWNIQMLRVDSSGLGGNIMSQELMDMNLNVDPFAIVGERRRDMLGELQVALERESIHFPNVPILVRQLRAFQYRRMRNGLWRAEAPPGEHDDEIFALVLGLQACNPSVPVGPVGTMGSRRYIQTQSEANGHSNPNRLSQKLLAKRRTNRMKQRMEKAGLLSPN